MSTQPKSKQDPRRSLVLVIAVVLIALWIWMTNRAEQTANVKAISAAAGRIGLVMGALWFAWPNLRRPASWLPPWICYVGDPYVGFYCNPAQNDRRACSRVCWLADVSFHPKGFSKLASRNQSKLDDLSCKTVAEA